MADIRLGSKTAVVTPALTDKHTITQGGNDYSETNAQVLGLLASDGLDTVKLDHISEKTSTHGVNIDGVLLKDNNVIPTGYVKSGLGRWPSNYLMTDDTTKDVVFDALNSYIPNVNDEMLIIGSYRTLGLLYFTSRAYRYDANTIRINILSMNTSTGIIDTAEDSFENGSSVQILNINIAW